MPESAARIRAATAADISAITAVYAHAVSFGTATFEIDPPDAAEMSRRYDFVIKRGLPFLVAEVEGSVCGYAYAVPYRARAAYRHTLEDSIYLAPEFQGRGIGRALIETLLAAAMALGYRQVIAVIGDSAQAASIALHRAAGFRIVGTFTGVGFKFDRWLDTVLMQRSLGSGSETPPDIIS